MRAHAYVYEQERKREVMGRGGKEDRLIDCLARDEGKYALCSKYQVPVNVEVRTCTNDTSK